MSPLVYSKWTPLVTLCQKNSNSGKKKKKIPYLSATIEMLYATNLINAKLGYYKKYKSVPFILIMFFFSLFIKRSNKVNLIVFNSLNSNV